MGGTELIPDAFDPVFSLLSDLTGLSLDGGLHPLPLVISGVIETESIAAFFQGTADITDSLALTLGGRYQEEERGLIASTVGTQDIPVLLDFGDQSVKTTNFSPKVTLDYKLTDEIMFYATWSKGFKSGTYNIVSIYTPPNYIRPEEVEAYEIGAKTEFMDGQLRLNGAIFKTSIDDLQVQVISLVSGGAVALENAGEAEIPGAEFDLTWQPFFASGLVLTLSGSYLDSKYTKFLNGSGYDETTGLFFGESSLASLITPGRDFSGNRITQTPEWSGTFGFGYTFFFGESELELGGDVYYNSGFFYSAQNSRPNQQEEYTVTNARVSYLYTPWDVRLTLSGRNIFDEKYYVYKFENDFGTVGTLHPPALYTASINWEF